MDAVIDIGSNSVRLLIDENLKVAKKDVCTTSLGDGLAKSGKLNDEAMARTEKAVAEFVQKARMKNAENIYIFGTEAMRAAENGIVFKQRLEKVTGLNVDVISGETEARLGLMGALSDMPGGEITLIDIGGASVEIVRGDEKRITYLKSLPLGMVRLIDLAGSKREDIERFVSDRIGEFGFVSGVEGVAIGGTATSLASMDLNQKVYDPNEVHGHVLTLDALKALTDRIFASEDLLKEFPTLPEKRARIIGHGAIMLSSLLEYLGLDSVKVSERDNLEGYLFAVGNKRK